MIWNVKSWACAKHRHPPPHTHTNTHSHPRYEDNLLDLPPADRASVDDLEREVMGLLSEVQRLSLRLGLPLPQSEAEAAASGQPGGGGAALPAAVRRYGPPPRASKGQSTAEYLRAAGVPAGEAIAVRWLGARC